MTEFLLRLLEGTSGAQGPQGGGAFGTQGPQGPSGSPGAQGPQGANGAQGAQGASGFSPGGTAVWRWGAATSFTNPCYFGYANATASTTDINPYIVDHACTLVFFQAQISNAITGANTWTHRLYLNGVAQPAWDLVFALGTGTYLTHTGTLALAAGDKLSMGTINTGALAQGAGPRVSVRATIP